MQPTILSFLESYLKWVEDGAPQDKPFNRAFGLCTNAAIYGIDFYIMAGHFHIDAPFNSGTDEYNHDSRLGNHHLNLFRIQWVKDKIKELKNESI